MAWRLKRESTTTASTMYGEQYNPVKQRYQLYVKRYQVKYFLKQIVKSTLVRERKKGESSQYVKEANK